nr:type II toxin-antitoxin system ParD family antitoxin [Okeania sp. KiyG1]
MNLSLTPELERFINSAVKRGRYSSAEEVVSTALQLLQEREMETTTPTSEPLLSELTGDLIGAIDSQAEPHHQSQIGNPQSQF